MQQALDVLIPLNIRQIHLLPFHQYGEPKYRLLGKTWSMKEVPAPSSADVATMREMAEPGRISGYRGRLKWHTRWQ